MHLNPSRAIVGAVVTTGALVGCGPHTAVPSGDETGGTGSTSQLTATVTDTEPGEVGDVDTLSTAGEGDSTGGSATDPTTTGGSATWPEARSLIELSSDECELFGVQVVLVAGQYVHVAATGGNAYHRHWVLDRDTGDVLATLPGGSLGVSEGFVYGAGFVGGGVGRPEAPFSLYRVAYDGTDFTELLVADDPIAIPLAFDGTALVQVNEPGGTRELWRADDRTTILETLGDVSNLETWAWIHDSGEVLVIDNAAQSLSVLDLMPLTLEPLVDLGAVGIGTAANSSHLFVATDDQQIVRAAKPTYDASTVATEVPLSALVADDETTVWAGDRSIYAADPGGDEANLVWTGREQVTELAMDADAVYFVEYIGESCERGHVFARIGRIDRP